jgi:hypothetical protein
LAHWGTSARIDEGVELADWSSAVREHRPDRASPGQYRRVNK